MQNLPGYNDAVLEQMLARIHTWSDKDLIRRIGEIQVTSVDLGEMRMIEAEIVRRQVAASERLEQATRAGVAAADRQAGRLFWATGAIIVLTIVLVVLTAALVLRR